MREIGCLLIAPTGTVARTPNAHIRITCTDFYRTLGACQLTSSHSPDPEPDDPFQAGTPIGRLLSTRTNDKVGWARRLGDYVRR
jgi:hypothetical protein